MSSTCMRIPIVTCAFLLAAVSNGGAQEKSADKMRKELGTIALDKASAPNAEQDKTLLFLPGQPHPGVEPADPMLVMRNAAYPISLGQRQ